MVLVVVVVEVVLLLVVLVVVVVVLLLLVVLVVVLLLVLVVVVVVVVAVAVVLGVMFLRPKVANYVRFLIIPTDRPTYRPVITFGSDWAYSGFKHDSSVTLKKTMSIDRT